MIFGAVPLRIYIATRPVDSRKGLDGLATVAKEVLKLDSFRGAAFIFRATRADRVKILIWDGSGLILHRSRESVMASTKVARPRRDIDFQMRIRRDHCAARAMQMIRDRCSSSTPGSARMTTSPPRSRCRLPPPCAEAHL